MQHANPFRMATDLGMLLAFTLTALFGLASASIPVLADDNAFPLAGSRAATAAAAVETDTATAAIAVEVLRPTVKEATLAAQDVMADVLAALVAQSVAESDIRASQLNVFAERFGPGGLPNGDEMRYHASNTLFITIRDLDSVDALLEAALAAGADNIYSVDFSISEPLPLPLNPKRAQAVVD